MSNLSSDRMLQVSLSGAGKLLLTVLGSLYLWLAGAQPELPLALAESRSSESPAWKVTKKIVVPPPFETKTILNQYVRLSWSSKGTLAASLQIAPQIPLINTETGEYTYLETIPRGSEFHQAWLPDGETLALHTDLELRLFSAPERRLLSVTSTGLFQTTGIKGLTLASGERVVAVAARPLDESKRNKDRVTIFKTGDGAEFLSWGAPFDSARFAINHLDLVSADGSVIAAIAAHHVTRISSGVGADLGDSIQDVWIVDLLQKRGGCQLNLYQAWERAGHRRFSQSVAALALSPDGRFLIVHTLNEPGLEVYSTENCHRQKLLAGRYGTPNAAGHRSMVFSTDGRYLLTAGPDVASPAGGWLNVWRVSDWSLEMRIPFPAANSVAAAPRSTQFAVGTFGAVYLVSPTK